LDTFLALYKRVRILTVICKTDCQGNRHLATDKTVPLNPAFTINNRMIYIEKAGAVNASGQMRTGNAAAHLVFSYTLAHFFYRHAYL